MNYVILHDASMIYYAIDFIIVLAVLAGLRIFSGVIANVSLNEILAKHDNFAMGISLAGAVLGVSIMLMGAVSGDAGASPGQEAMLMLSYGVVGILLMLVTRKVFDKLSLPQISVHEQIQAGNVAAGIVDAGNLIATAIIVRAVMSWVDGAPFIGLAAVIAGYVTSQLIMLIATWYRSIVFAKRHPGNSLHQEIQTGNVALAVRFSGHRIGVALAVTAASGLVIYYPDTIPKSLLVWSLMALVMFFAQTVISIAARHILLPGVNVAEEVGRQKNVAIGTLEASIYIAIGLIFVGLLG